MKSTPFSGFERPELDEDVFIEWNGTDNGLADPLDVERLPAWTTTLGPPEEAVASITDPVRTVVTADGWKLNLSPLGEHEMYDLCNDPLETRNLARDNMHRGRMKELSARIVRWQKENGEQIWS